MDHNSSCKLLVDVIFNAIEGVLGLFVALFQTLILLLVFLFLNPPCFKPKILKSNSSVQTLFDFFIICAESSFELSNLLKICKALDSFCLHFNAVRSCTRYDLSAIFQPADETDLVSFENWSRWTLV